MHRSPLLVGARMSCARFHQGGMVGCKWRGQLEHLRLQAAVFAEQLFDVVALAADLPCCLVQELFANLDIYFQLHVFITK